MRDDDAAALVRERMEAARRDLEVPGVAWGLLRDGVVIDTGGAGECEQGSGEVPGASTVFRIASMTKSFTAAAVLMLRDRGDLRLDDEVAVHCPWVAGIGVPAGAHPLTVRDLLTMQAGLPTDDPWGDRQEPLPIAEFDALVSRGLSFARPPRTAFEYSNLGYALLGRVIAAASGEEYRAFVRSALLDPLGLNATRFEAHDVPADRLAQGYAPVADGLVPEPTVVPGAFSPMGGLHSTVDDLAVWVAGFQHALAHRDLPHPLGAASLREMQQPQRLIGTVTVPATVTASYGFGLIVDDDLALGRFVSHSGGYPGYGSHMRWHEDTGWALIGLGNRTYANMRGTCTAIMSELVAGTERARQPELWPATRAAQDVAESLLREWDDVLLDAHAAVNIDLDRPRAERRAEWERLAATIGDFERAGAFTESDSPAHARWCVDGEFGRVRLEVRLTPEFPPRIQTLTAVALAST